MNQPMPQLRMTEAAYLAFDRAAEVKHILWDGEVFAMAGASLAHNRLVRNLGYELTRALRGSSCEPLPSDMRVRIPPSDRYVYPDLTIVCGRPRLEGQDILLNPTTILEVLSPSTEAFDRGDKFMAYRAIEGLREVVFVSQFVRRIECYTRQVDGSWLLRVYQDNESAVIHELPSPLPLDLVYHGVDLVEPAD